MCHCEISQAFYQTWRKARKAHRCCECGGTIRAGERYRYASGVWDGYPDSFKTCVLCDAVKTDHIANLDRYDCAPCFTQLYEEWPEDVWPTHLAVEVMWREAMRP